MRVCATVWRGMADRLGVHAAGVAEQLADQVEIVDRMHGDLDARRLEQERPQLPRRGERQPGIEVDDLAEPALGDGVLQRQHHRREAQLEIDRGLELLGAADLEDRGRLGEIAAHRLLDQRHRAVGQRLQHIGMTRRRRGKVEDRVLDGGRLLDRAEGRHAPGVGKLLGLGAGRDRRGRRPESRPCGRPGNARRRRSSRRRR